MPRLQIPKKLLKLQQVKKRFKIVIGGRGSAKSTTVADLCLMDSQVSGLKIGCFREFQNSIEDSVHSLLSDEIERLGIGGYVIQNNTIYNNNGGEFKFRGLSRNTESVKSMHGFDRFWVEEAQFLSAKSLKMLTPTLREDDSEIWMTANPMSAADPFSQRFIIPFEKELLKNGYYEDDLHLIVVCNYVDNPFFPDVLEQERVYDKEHLPSAEYEHIWEGRFNDTVQNAIIPVDWFNAAIDAHEKLGFEPTGIEIVSHDPSDLGPDSKGLCHRHGSVVLDILEKDTGTIDEGAKWALDYAIEKQVDAFIWDGDGMGVGIRQTVSDALTGKQIEPHMFRGSEGADNPASLYMPAGDGKKDIKGKTNKDTFFNKRAQYYWMLRDRFYSTYLAVEKGQYIDPDKLISLSSNIENLDQLRAEVCRIPRKPNGNGKIQIMSKEEMKKKPYEIPSPNLADSLMMSLDTPQINTAGAVELNFASLWS
jgi:phage terminase large subunit